MDGGAPLKNISSLLMDVRPPYNMSVLTGEPCRDSAVKHARASIGLCRWTACEGQSGPSGAGGRLEVRGRGDVNVNQGWIALQHVGQGRGSATQLHFTVSH